MNIIQHFLFLDQIFGLIFCAIATFIPIYYFARLPSQNRSLGTLLICLGVLEIGPILILTIFIMNGIPGYTGIGIGLASIALGLTASSILIGSATEQQGDSAFNTGLLFLGFQELPIVLIYLGTFIPGLKLPSWGLALVNFGIYFIANATINANINGYYSTGTGILQAAFVELNLILAFLLGLLLTNQLLIFFGSLGFGTIAILLGVFSASFLETQAIERRESSDFILTVGIFEIITILLFIILLLA